MRLVGTALCCRPPPLDLRNGGHRVTRPTTWTWLKSVGKRYPTASSGGPLGPALRAAGGAVQRKRRSSRKSQKHSGLLQDHVVFFATWFVWDHAFYSP